LQGTSPTLLKEKMLPKVDKILHKYKFKNGVKNNILLPVTIRNKERKMVKMLTNKKN
jgi:hypothetical protein